MSSYDDDDLDDDLPCVSLSQSTGGKSELEMPPASELASLRAREEAAERALQDFHENNDPLLVSLSRSTSQGSTSGEEGEAALTAAVSALQVTEAEPKTRAMHLERLQLLTSMRDYFPENKPFLDDYIKMLEEKPEAVDYVTEHILQGISSALISRRPPTNPGICAWLLCVALSSPRALRVRRALGALLDAHVSTEHVDVIAVATSRAINDAEQLLAAYDAVRTGGRRGADRLAATLLAHASARALRPDTASSDTDPPHPLSSETVSLVRSSWRKMATHAQLTLLRCAGRALAAGDKGDRGAMHPGEKGDMTDVGQAGEKMDSEDIHVEDIGEIKDNENRNPTDTGADLSSRNNTNDLNGTRENLQDKECEGGAVLLAALAQPLPRAPAFDIHRQQVLTNVSKLKLLFRERFTRPQEDPIQTPLNCSQNSLDDSIDTPIQTPKKEPMEMKIKIPMNLVTPMKLQYPILKTPLKETAKEMKMVKGQLKLDGFFKQGTQVNVKEFDGRTDDGERSPEKKRIKRHRPERRCGQKTGKN